VIVRRGRDVDGEFVGGERRLIRAWHRVESLEAYQWPERLREVARRLKGRLGIRRLRVRWLGVLVGRGGSVELPPVELPPAEGEREDGREGPGAAHETEYATAALGPQREGVALEPPPFSGLPGTASTVEKPLPCRSRALQSPQPVQLAQ